MSKNKLVFFDLDGTLLTGMEYSWQHLWQYFNVDKSLTKPLAVKYFSGEITYEAWVDACCDLLKERSITLKMLEEAFSEITPVEGAREVLYTLKDKGYLLFVISGGISVALDVGLPEEKALFEAVFINQFNFDERGVLLSAIATPYDGESKATCVLDMAAQYDSKLEDTVFIGDNDNDVAAARTAGISIAFNSKSEELNKIATHVATTDDLREILAYILK
jgi:HAD superfamily phosphoserine phosphatase-like hydrolase